MSDPTPKRTSDAIVAALCPMRPSTRRLDGVASAETVEVEQVWLAVIAGDPVRARGRLAPSADLQQLLAGGGTHWLIAAGERAAAPSADLLQVAACPQRPVVSVAAFPREQCQLAADHAPKRQLAAQRQKPSKPPDRPSVILRKLVTTQRRHACWLRPPGAHHRGSYRSPECRDRLRPVMVAHPPSFDCVLVQKLLDLRRHRLPLTPLHRY